MANKRPGGGLGKRLNWIESADNFSPRSLVVVSSLKKNGVEQSKMAKTFISTFILGAEAPLATC